MSSRDDDPPTPRESGSHQRGPIFAGLAKACAERLQAKGKFVEARQALVLADKFSGWTTKDPGQDVRMLMLSELLIYREMVGL